MHLFRKKYTDEELVKGCLSNDRKWQERLYRRYFPAMIAMCMRYATDQDEALSIVNNGFLRVFQKIHLYSGHGSLEGWIRKLVWHSLADHYKEQARYLRFLVFEERDRAVRSAADDDLLLQDLMNLIERLPPASKTVFRLFAVEGYSHAEIATELGISEGTSKWHLNAARTRLKAWLEAIDNHANQQTIQSVRGVEGG